MDGLACQVRTVTEPPSRWMQTLCRMWAPSEGVVWSVSRSMLIQCADMSSLSSGLRMTLCSCSREAALQTPAGIVQSSGPNIHAICFLMHEIMMTPLKCMTGCQPVGGSHLTGVQHL